METDKSSAHLHSIGLSADVEKKSAKGGIIVFGGQLAKLAYTNNI